MAKRGLLVALWALLLVGWGMPPPAEAQLSADARRCIDLYNNKARKVSGAQGKVNRACVKAAGRGTESNPDGCLTADAGGRVAKAQAALTDAVQQYCPAPGTLPIVIDASTANAAHAQGSVNLLHDMFGPALNDAGLISAPHADARCRDRAVLRVAKLFDAHLKEFRKCKKRSLRNGTVIDEASLASVCLDDGNTNGIPDPNGKIANRTITLVNNVVSACGGLATPLAQLMPGECAQAATAAELADCLTRQTRCRVCDTINRADGTARDCDDLDDGLINGSCALADHVCAVQSTSRVALHVSALPVPLLFPVTGAVTFSVADPNQGNGTGTARCDEFSFSPINFPSIGFVCIAPGTSCPSGARDCNGGAALGTDLLADGRVGACSANGQCQNTCHAYCGLLGRASTFAGCTGFCSAGAMAACTADAACLPADGQCNGPDPVLPSQAGICQCVCTDTAAGGASPSGGLQCQLGVDLNVEAGPPCDGVDTVVAVGDRCLPITTATATGQIVDANFLPGTMVPNGPPISLIGAPIACGVLDGSVTDDLRTVGTTAFFASALGDLAVGLELNCFGAAVPSGTPGPTLTPSLTRTVTSTPTVTRTPTVTLTPTDTPLGTSAHLCPLQPATSKASLHIAALPLPLQFGLTGSYAPRVGPPDGNGVGSARCGDFSVAPLNIPCIGFVCLKPQDTCPAGSRDCDGGTPLGVDAAADGNIGPCTGNADCDTACDTHCAGQGKVRVDSSTACTGFCSAGAKGACTADAQCLPDDGSCNGPNPIGSNGGICQCACVDIAAGPASPAGAFQCQLGLDLSFESGLPCDGTDQLIDIGNSCLPMTTELATGIITDANFTAGSIVPNTGTLGLQGARTDCATVDSSVTDGLRTVGTAAFFGAALGDILLGVELSCPGAVLPTPTVTRTATGTNTGTTTLTPTQTRTPTETRTPTLTRTPTPTGGTPGTVTPEPVAHTCAFASPSSFEIHIQALPVPLTFMISGTVDVIADSPGSGVNGASCAIQSINPVSIPSIGIVCLLPGPGCPTGTRDCGGGTALGVDLLSDANIGACTSNAACQSTCNGYCTGLGKVNTVTGTGCTGFCSSGSMAACTSDADCVPADGICNGPEPVGFDGGLCQCSCLDAAAGGASDPGDLQCRLPTSFTVENGLPCGDGDVLIPFGDLCLPLSTQSATAQILNANRIPGAVLPNPPTTLDLTGIPLDCGTLDSSVTAGMRLVGTNNQFDTAFGDMVIGVSVNCQ